MSNKDSEKKLSIREMEEKQRIEDEKAFKDRLEKYAIDRFGLEKLAQWQKDHKSIWYLPLIKDGEIVAFGVFKPITRNILSYSHTKMENGSYAMTEVQMRECLLDGDQDIFDEEEMAIAAAQAFNGRRVEYEAALVKR